MKLKSLKAFFSDSYKSKRHKGDNKIRYVMISYDIHGADTSIYKKIENHLENKGFYKYITIKDFNKTEDESLNIVRLPNNTYAGAVKQNDIKSINIIKERAENMIRSILDIYFNHELIEGYNYFVFTANQWSFASGEITKVYVPA